MHGTFQPMMVEMFRKSRNLLHTIPQKNMSLPYFGQLTIHLQQNSFEKTLGKVGRSHLYTSFGTFFVQIGQLFEAQ